MRQPPIALALLLLLLGAGCTSAPKRYPPPLQRSQNLKPWEVDPPFSEMNAVDAEQFFVRDISSNLEGGAWRWTFERPELKFVLNCTAGQTLAADYGVVAATLAETGPVTISFRVNDRLLDKVYFATPADRHFEKPVPESWLSTKEYTRVSIQADKLFFGASDGVKLGFVLYRAGFIESCGKSSTF